MYSSTPNPFAQVGVGVISSSSVIRIFFDVSFVGAVVGAVVDAADTLKAIHKAVEEVLRMDCRRMFKEVPGFMDVRRKLHPPPPPLSLSLSLSLSLLYVVLFSVSQLCAVPRC